MDMRGRSIAVVSDRFDIPIGAGPVLPPPHAEDDDEVPPPPPPRHQLYPAGDPATTDKIEKSKGFYTIRTPFEASSTPKVPRTSRGIEAKKTQIQIERDNDFLMNESLHADNAMGAFNPWGGRYKGIALDGADPPREDSKDDMAVAPVAFQIKKGGRKHQGKHVDVSLSRAKTWQLDSFTTSKWMQLFRTPWLTCP
ncbi:hypothetical protein DYB32_010481 [Aphanomyces invadans]|uniref:Uncharacterized protein n=1 Tax=Aphanomyces invadans TaxID=157072 RepID=A0A418AG02_9STRA|nr:hypothetical protein DYB32_010481 [Aphanomyces invadans]